jgi:hypothetical protein
MKQRWMDIIYKIKIKPNQTIEQFCIVISILRITLLNIYNIYTHACIYTFNYIQTHETDKHTLHT